MTMIDNDDEDNDDDDLDHNENVVFAHSPPDYYTGAGPTTQLVRLPVCEFGNPKECG